MLAAREGIAGRPLLAAATRACCSGTRGIVFASQKSALRGVQLRFSETMCRNSRRPAMAVAAASGSADSGRPIKPAYNKYRSRADIEKSYLRQWQEVTARGDSGQERMTVFSALAFLPLWAKYRLVPDFVLFLWWLVWVRLRAVYHFFHRRAVKQGAKLDAWLAAKSGQPPRFSRAVVLRRYHYRVPVWQTLRYRWRLLRGQAQVASNEQQPAAQPQTA